MKKFLTGTIALLMMSSVGLASPLTDYSKGNTAIDLNWRNTELHAVHKDHGLDDDFNKQYNLDWSVTTGLGNDFAIQYRQYNANSCDTYLAKYSCTSSMELKTKELNVLYKLNKSTSAYLGVMKTKGIKIIKENSAFNDDTKDKNRVQIGLLGSTKLADKTTGFASVGVGDDLTTWEVGVSQEIAPNLELNLDYREIKADNLKPNKDIGTLDEKAKGLGFGLTYKF